MRALAMRCPHTLPASNPRNLNKVIACTLWKVDASTVVPTIMIVGTTVFASTSYSVHAITAASSSRLCHTMQRFMLSYHWLEHLTFTTMLSAKIVSHNPPLLDK
jgi:hypothetical protein